MTSLLVLATTALAGEAQGLPPASPLGPPRSWQANTVLLGGADRAQGIMAPSGQLRASGSAGGITGPWGIQGSAMGSFAAVDGAVYDYGFTAGRIRRLDGLPLSAGVSLQGGMASGAWGELRPGVGLAGDDGLDWGVEVGAALRGDEGAQGIGPAAAAWVFEDRGGLGGGLRGEARLFSEGLPSHQVDLSAQLFRVWSPRWSSDLWLGAAHTGGAKDTGYLAQLPHTESWTGRGGLGGQWSITSTIALRAELSGTLAGGPEPWRHLRAGVGLSAARARSSRTAPLRPGPVRFALDAPDASEVAIIGSFTGWEPVPMELRGGRWQVQLELPAGTHEYAYIVNGTATAPPEATQTRDDDFGGRNAVLVVPSLQR